jgi:hypothetical protein
MTRTIRPAKGAGRGIEKDRHARDGRDDLGQHPQPFAGHRRVVICEAGDIAAGFRVALQGSLDQWVSWCGMPVHLNHFGWISAVPDLRGL